MSVAAAVSILPVVRRPAPGGAAGGPITFRRGTSADAGAIHALIAGHQQEAHLLPRNPGEIGVHAHRFVIAMAGDRLVGCADLAPLSRTVAEIRSLVVSPDARAAGTGRQIVGELVREAAAAGFEKVCAFTHLPAYFAQLGFSIVPHAWLPEKIETNCRSCSQFRDCGQYAVMLSLTRSHYSCVPLGSLHG